MFLRRLADRWLVTEFARLLAWCSLAIWVGLVAYGFLTNKQGRTSFNENLGGDYAEFHVAGQILNEGKGSRLYDVAFQDRQLHDLLPLFPESQHLPFVYPPFVACWFKPLAYLPFTGSVACWLALSIAIYAMAVGLILRHCSALSRPEKTTAWLLALAFEPFAMECCLGGQISTLGCLFVAGGWLTQVGGRPILAGLILSLLFYKPTLLVLILPMLVIGRSWRTLLGMALGSAILALTSWFIVGSSGSLDFLQLITGYGKMGGSVRSGFNTIKYVDLTAFFQLLGVDRRFCRPLALVIGLPALIGLIRVWTSTKPGPTSDLTWAATICWTPLLNIYGPIYDVTLVVPGLLMGANALRVREPDRWPARFRLLIALLFVSATMTLPSALFCRFQPVTPALLAVATYFLILAVREASASARLPIIQD